MDEKSETPTEDTRLTDRLDKLTEQYGDPLEILFEMAANKMVPMKERIAAANAACSYKYPKQKQVELDTKGPLVPPVLEVIVTQVKAPS